MKIFYAEQMFSTEEIFFNNADWISSESSIKWESPYLQNNSLVYFRRKIYFSYHKMIPEHFIRKTDKGSYSMLFLIELKSSRR